MARSHSVPPSLRERRPLAARVARDPGDLLDRDEDAVAAGERELEVVAVLPRPAASEHLLVARDAVVDVDDEVAGRQPLQDVARHDPAKRLGSPDPDRPEQLAVRDEDDAVRPADEPAVEAAADERDRPGRRRLGDPVDDRDRVTGLAEQLGEPRRLVRGEDDPARRPRASRRPRRRRPAARPNGRTGSRQPKRSPDESAPRAIAASVGGSDSQVSSSVRDATSRDFQSRGGEVGRRPVLGQLARRR